MLQKNTENGPKSTQNPIKMGPGTPWVSIVKLRSELYGFWVLLGVPLWPYFLTCFGVLFETFFALIMYFLYVCFVSVVGDGVWD